MAGDGFERCAYQANHTLTPRMPLANLHLNLFLRAKANFQVWDAPIELSQLACTPGTRLADPHLLRSPSCQGGLTLVTLIRSRNEYGLGPCCGLI